MSIHLVGGGYGDEVREAYASFIAEAAARSYGSGRVVTRVAVLLVSDDANDGNAMDGTGHHDDADRDGSAIIDEILQAGSCETVLFQVREGVRFPSHVLSDTDGLVVAGGHIPSYLTAVEGITGEIRLLVSDGLPYLGFSAGAAIAADSVVSGGWRVGGVPVCPEAASEELDEVAIMPGLGLVDLAIDVQAAQRGTLGRVIAAAEAGLIDGGVAINERTALIVGEGALRVVGAGSVWKVTVTDGGVLVGAMGA